MPLDPQKEPQVTKVWQQYIQGGEHFLNASQEFTNIELDRRRRETIPQVQDWINRFLKGEIPTEEFKTAIDGINKRNRLWGFRGVNGQMFFNMLTKQSQADNRLPYLTNLLKQTLPRPPGLVEMKSRIEEFTVFTRELARQNQDLRSAPKVGSIPYFLSYFWQIESPDEMPIYYTSMVSVLVELEIWSPVGNPAENYLSFYHLNHDMLSFLSLLSNRSLHLWDVEHAFWVHSQQKPPIIEPVPPKSPIIVPAPATEELSESFIPPVVAILPRLAMNDEAMTKICQRANRSVERTFEERIAILLRMLGYEVELMGQGSGRAPDGVAISQEYRYAIIYDAKVRGSGPYTMGTDERAIREYIANTGDKLRKQGLRNVYFMIISSGFSGDHDDVIRNIKIDTDVREVLLVEATALLTMLEGKLRNPGINLGPNGIQHLFANSGLLSSADIQEFFGS